MDTDSLEVILIESKDRHIIKNLYSLYLHDLSEYTNEDVSLKGLYDTNFLDLFWRKDGLIPLLIKVDSKIAGFVLIQSGQYAPSTGEDYYISQFFILREYRRKGIGKKTVKKLFSQFPGKYLVGQIPSNKPAINFWKNIYKSCRIIYEENIGYPQNTIMVFQHFKINKFR